MERISSRIARIGLVVPLFVLLAGLAAACGDDDDEEPTGTATTAATAATTAATPADVTIQVTDNAFPAETRIAVGQAVVWDFSSASNQHTVTGTSDNATSLLDSEVFQGSGTYEVTFTEAGTYAYECAVHGAAMAGTIVVG